MTELLIQVGASGVALFFAVKYYLERERSAKYVARAKRYDELYAAYKRKEEYVRQLETKLVQSASPDELAALLTSVWGSDIAKPGKP